MAQEYKMRVDLTDRNGRLIKSQMVSGLLESEVRAAAQQLKKEFLAAADPNNSYAFVNVTTH